MTDVEKLELCYVKDVFYLVDFIMGEVYDLQVEEGLDVRRNGPDAIVAEVELTYLLGAHEMRQLFDFGGVQLRFGLLFVKIGQH